MVEVVVTQPFPSGLIGVDTTVARHRGIEVGHFSAGQLGRYRVEDLREPIRLLLRIHQRDDVSGQKVVQWIVECNQVALQERGRGTEDVGRVDLPFGQGAHGDGASVVTDSYEVAR